MANKVITRLSDAYRTLFKQADRPNYGRAYEPERLFRFTGWGWNKDRWGTEIDYRGQVGPLENSSLVMAVINVTGVQLSEAMPIVMKPGPKGFEQPDHGHACSNIIRRPNPFHIWADYTFAFSLSWWIDGNAYFRKVHDTTGQVVELWFLPHDQVQPRWPNDGKEPAVPRSGKNKATNDFLSHYEFRVDNRDPELIPAEDIIHIKRGVNPAAPREGIGAFGSVIKEIYGDNKASLFTATILKNMGIVVPLLSPKEPGVTITETAAKEIKEKWIKGTTGDNAGVPMVNPIALEATKFAFSPQELDLKELRMIPESRIAAVTNIPAPVLQFLVGLVNGTSYASYEQARAQCYESVIIPIQSRLAENFTWQLLPDFDTAKGARVHFDLSSVRILQEDQDSLMKRAAVGFQSGVLKRSDAREMVGLETTPEDEIYNGELTGSEPPEVPEDDVEKYIQYLDQELRDFTK